MANIDKKSKKATPFVEIFSSTPIIPPSPIFQQRINLAELSYLELDSLQGVNFISGSIFSDNYNLVSPKVFC